MPDGREISFYLRHGFNDDQGQRWRLIRLAVGPDIVWDMLPNPTTPRSSISRRAFNDLRVRGLVPPERSGRIRLENVRIAGQRVPDVNVTISMVVNRLEVDGILGLDFFELFSEVHWFPRTHKIVLIDP